MKNILKIILAFILFMILFVIYFLLISFLVMLPIGLTKGWDDPIWLAIMIVSFIISPYLSYKTIKGLMNL